jgi:hypothetical protein
MEKGSDADASPPKGISGKPIVFAVFGGALLMWGIVLMIGFREKRARHAHEDVATIDAPDSLRAWIRGLPGRWMRVTQVEGQGWVIYVPCYSSKGELTLRAPADSLPALACEYCDSLDAYTVKSARRPRNDSAWELALEPAAGTLRLVPVGDSLLKAFPEAPFKDRILVWARARGAERSDSMIFVPASQEGEFETLRAEDENPEGCGGADPD